MDTLHKISHVPFTRQDFFFFYRCGGALRPVPKSKLTRDSETSDSIVADQLLARRMLIHNNRVQH